MNFSFLFTLSLAEKPTCSYRSHENSAAVLACGLTYFFKFAKFKVTELVELIFVFLFFHLVRRTYIREKNRDIFRRPSSNEYIKSCYKYSDVSLLYLLYSY